MLVKPFDSLGEVLELRVERWQLGGAGAVLLPLVLPQGVLFGAILNVWPLGVQLFLDRSQRRRVEMPSVVAEARSNRA